jgi:hypothetical protein
LLGNDIDGKADQAFGIVVESYVDARREQPEVRIEPSNLQIDRNKFLGSMNASYEIAHNTPSPRPNQETLRAGDSWFDPILGKPIFWSGVEWVDALGNKS